MRMKSFLCALCASAVLTFAQNHPEYSVKQTTAPHASLLTAALDPWNDATEISWGTAPYITGFRAVWNSQGLYVRFNALDDSPWHTMKKRDDHLWEEEVVEIFLDLNRSGRDYAELEINPANVVCDLHMISPSPDKKGDISWDFKGLQSRVFPLRDGGGENIGWTAIAFMPWEDFKTLPSASAISLPPKAGDRWRFNVFRIKRPGGKSQPGKDPILAAWSPPGAPSFHTPSAFRDFIFVQ